MESGPCHRAGTRQQHLQAETQPEVRLDTEMVNTLLKIQTDDGAIESVTFVKTTKGNDFKPPNRNNQIINLKYIKGIVKLDGCKEDSAHRIHRSLSQATLSSKTSPW